MLYVPTSLDRCFNQRAPSFPFMFILHVKTPRKVVALSQLHGRSLSTSFPTKFRKSYFLGFFLIWISFRDPNILSRRPPWGGQAQGHFVMLHLLFGFPPQSSHTRESSPSFQASKGVLPNNPRRSRVRALPPSEDLATPIRVYLPPPPTEDRLLGPLVSLPPSLSPYAHVSSLSSSFRRIGPLT